jgi:hypothetical protein
MFICPKKIMMALLFMLLAAPVAFQAVRGILGGWIATAEGMPKVGGLAVHALVFMLLSTLIWRYVPFGSSMFEGDEEYRISRKGVARNRATWWADRKRAAESYNQPDPSKMHAGVYH